MSPEVETRNPVEQTVDLVTRTLRILYAAFWFALAAYLVLLVVILPLTPAPAEARPLLPRNWSQWRYFFGMAGIASLYISQRLRAALTDPVRLRAASPVPAVVGRMISGRVILWCLVEIPALLGVMDRWLSGELRYSLALIAMSGLGLLLHRPLRDRVEETLAPLGGTVPSP